ncbi:MAG: hypothetical protein RM368_16530 [Nostoc sp. DedSLP03]|uniref:hypothetical protein n=1 Tax=Nostoc sp. DedSLP03 TaxID=3075400 RepID=UPI002AD21262|nr:hypothetical protein [Nostoc sp. DedSLP03]MDZ7966558.1 hypothetical protein [Nostoc sp. DedSLP03]
MTKANIMLLCESTSKKCSSQTKSKTSSEAIAQSGKNIFNLVGQKTQLMVE